ALAVLARQCAVVIVLAQHLAVAPFFGRERTRGKYGAGGFVAGGFALADRAPVFQIANGVEDTAADLAIGRPGPVGPMFLKGSDGYAEEARGFFGAQQARRQSRKRVGHGSPPVGIGLPGAAADCGEPWRGIGGA